MDIDEGLIGTPPMKNPQEFDREGYLKFCNEMFGGRGQEIERGNNEEKNNTVQQSKYNDWVEGWDEMKQEYLDGLKRRND